MIKHGVLIAAAGLLLTAGSAYAQQEQPARISQDAYYMYSGQAHDAHAYDWARILKQFSDSKESVPIDLVADTVKAIRENVQAAQKAYDKLSETVKKNPQTAQKLVEVEKQHAQILELCEALDTKETQTSANAKAMCERCDEVMQRLVAAHTASIKAAQRENIVTRELKKPGRGVFSD